MLRAGGMWGTIDLTYDETEVHNKKIRPFKVTTFTPFQVSISSRFCLPPFPASLRFPRHDHIPADDAEGFPFLHRLYHSAGKPF